MCTVAASSQLIFRRGDVFRSATLQSGPRHFEDLVHVEEYFGEGGSEVAPLACVRMSVCGMLYADDAGVLSKSTKDLAKMMIANVTVFE